MRGQLRSSGESRGQRCESGQSGESCWRDRSEQRCEGQRCEREAKRERSERSERPESERPDRRGGVCGCIFHHSTVSNSCLRTQRWPRGRVQFIFKVNDQRFLNSKNLEINKSKSGYAACMPENKYCSPYAATTIITITTAGDDCRLK